MYIILPLALPPLPGFIPSLLLIFFFSNAQILFQFSTSVYILNFISYLNLQTSVGFLASVLAACISGWKEFQGTYAPLLIPAVPICYFPAVQ